MDINRSSVFHRLVGKNPLSKSMNKLLLLLSFGLTTAYAAGVQSVKPVVCFESVQFHKVITTVYKQEPMVVGKTSDIKQTKTIVYLNKGTGEFTVVEMDDEAACILSRGTEVHYRFPKLGTPL